MAVQNIDCLLALTQKWQHFSHRQLYTRVYNYQCAQNSLTQVVNLPVEVGGAVYN